MPLRGAVQLSRSRLIIAVGFAQAGLSVNRIACLVLVALATATGWAQLPTPSVPASASPVRSLPLPTTFAPAPFALPGSRQAAEKQLCSLVRRLQPVLTADLLVSGDEPALDCKVLLSCRPGHQMTPEALQGIALLCTNSLPGLSSQRLSILDTQGRLLYSDGQVQTTSLPPPGRANPLPWLLVAAALAVVGAFLAVQGRRAVAPTAAGAWAGLTRRNEPELLSLLAGERPEIIGLLLENLPAPVAKRLRRQLQRNQITFATPAMAVDAQVLETVKRSLQRRLAGL